MESPNDKMIRTGDESTKGLSKSEQRRRAALAQKDDVQIGRTEADEVAGKQKFFFPQEQRSVEADSQEEAEEIINKED